MHLLTTHHHAEDEPGLLTSPFRHWKQGTQGLFIGIVTKAGVVGEVVRGKCRQLYLNNKTIKK